MSTSPVQYTEYGIPIRNLWHMLLYAWNEFGEGGIVAPTGKPGSVLMFHGNLVHASAPNITPYPRKIVYLTLCACSNHITKFTRPEWIAHRDFTPIVPGEDDSLLEYARAHRVAAE